MVSADIRRFLSSAHLPKKATGVIEFVICGILHRHSESFPYFRLNVAGTTQSASGMELAKLGLRLCASLGVLRSVSFDCLVMLKRLSSLALVLLLGGSVWAAAAQVKSEHVCAMSSMEMPDMDAMSCCGEEQAKVPTFEQDDMLNCCIAIPPSPGSSGITFKLRPPSFSFASVHPAIAQAPILFRHHKHLSMQVFLPNFRASYIRNLSLLI